MSEADAPPRNVDVLVVGAGFAGIGTGIQLLRRGRQSFVIIEQADDVGGTWRDNRYPGVACDVPAHLYSFSFRPNPRWSRLFAEGAEIHEYLRRSVDEEGLREHLLLDCGLLRATWDEGAMRWSVQTTRGDFCAGTLIVATGRLSEPKIPSIEGLDRYTGKWWHSAQWNPKVSLVGKRVGLVGTGASALQILPRLADEAAQVVLFQRSAPYVLPRGDRVYSHGELDRFASDPDSLAALREELFADAERGLAARQRRHPDIDELARRADEHRAGAVADADLRALLTPDYEIGCKRILFSDDYYPALQRDHVTLEPSSLRRTDRRTATAVSGRSYDLDVLVLATGFDASRPTIAERIYGRDGRQLADTWRDRMIAYASTAVHGFPNMYVLDGPNSALGHNSAIVMIEAQINYVLGALDHLAACGSTAQEVSEAAVRAYGQTIDELASETVWTQGGCQSWYLDERTGRVTLLWPDTAAAFLQRFSVFDPSVYTAA